MNATLRFQALRKGFGQRLVLDGVDLAIGPGRLLLLSGPNGAGKTTLLKILAGIEQPDGGTLTTDDGPLRWSRAKTRLRRRLVYLHQHPYLFDRGVLDNLVYGLDGARRSRRARALQALDEVGLAHLAKRDDITGLSGGERQRLALARALLREPDYLLLDEPTANLDPQARRLCLALLGQLRARGIGLLVASHDLDGISELADEHWHLAEGRLHRVQPREPSDAPDLSLPPFTVIAGGKP